MFNHQFAKLPELKQVNSESGRKYETVDGKFAYPSITTVLGATADKSGLYAWRKRVGEKKANQISRAATTRGTSMHKLCEDFLLNKELDDLGSTSGELLFRGIRPVLERIDNVRALESRLISHKLHVAGTVDCIADFDGKLSVIDFKTASRTKRRTNISDYFMQGCFYTTAYWEATGELPHQIVILISVQDGSTQEFTLNRSEIIYWTEQLRKRIGAYYDSHPTAA